MRVYHAHQSRVTDTCFSSASNWILSSGRDKYFYFHCTVTGKRLGGYLCNAWCTGLAYDEEAQYVFVGDYSGAITVCKLEQSGVKFINTLKVSQKSIVSRHLSINHHCSCYRATAAVSSALRGTGPSILHQLLEEGVIQEAVLVRVDHAQSLEDFRLFGFVEAGHNIPGNSLLS